MLFWLNYGSVTCHLSCKFWHATRHGLKLPESLQLHPVCEGAPISSECMACITHGNCARKEMIINRRVSVASIQPWHAKFSSRPPTSFSLDRLLWIIEWMFVVKIKIYPFNWGRLWFKSLYKYRRNVTLIYDILINPSN